MGALFDDDDERGGDVTLLKFALNVHPVSQEKLDTTLAHNFAKY